MLNTDHKDCDHHEMIVMTKEMRNDMMMLLINWSTRMRRRTWTRWGWPSWWWRRRQPCSTCSWDGLINKDEHEDEDQDDDEHGNEGENGIRMDEKDNLAELLLMNWWTRMTNRMSMKTTGEWLRWGWGQPCRIAAPWRSCRCCPKEGSTRRCTSHWEPPLKVIPIGDVLNLVSSSLSSLFS